MTFIGIKFAALVLLIEVGGSSRKCSFFSPEDVYVEILKGRMVSADCFSVFPHRRRTRLVYIT